MIQPIHFWNIPKGIESKVVQRCLYIYVHKNIFRNDQEAEAARMSIHK